MSETAPKPSWLKTRLADATRSLIRTLTPHQYIARTNAVRPETVAPVTVTLPLSGAKADDLFDDLRRHFYDWTGQDIQNYRKGG